MSRPLANGAVVRAVGEAELRALLRDRRALFTAVVLPVLLYPVIFLGMGKLEETTESSLEEREVRVAYELSALDSPVAARVRECLEDPELRIELSIAAGVPLHEDGDPLPAPEVLGADLDLLLAARPGPGTGAGGARPEILLWTDRSRDLSNIALQRVTRELRALAEEIETERLFEITGNDPAALLTVVERDLAPPENAAGHALGRLLPLIAVLVLISGASFAALGAFAGEREAGTLETLLVQPVPAMAVAVAKFLAVLIVALVALAGNAGSFYACGRLGLGIPGAEGVAFGRLALGLLFFLPAAVLLAGASCLVAAKAKSFREGQHYVLPLILLSAAPASLSLMDPVELDWILALVPIAGSSLALRDAMSGSLPLGPAVMSLFAGIGWSWWVLRRVAGSLDAERLLASSGGSAESAARRLQSRRALTWGVAAVIAIYFVGGRMQMIDVRWGLAATLWGIALGIALLAARGTARRAGESLVDTLGLRAPAPWHLVGAPLLAPLLAAGVGELLRFQSTFLPLPPTGDALGEIAELSVPTLVLLMAVSPGICEELLFRGAILSGLRRDLSTPRILMWQALLFAAAHASIHRFAPTALLGALLAAITLRARCIWPAVLLHATYNGLVVTDRVAWGREHLAISIPLAIVGAGLLLVARRRG